MYFAWMATVYQKWVYKRMHAVPRKTKEGLGRQRAGETRPRPKDSSSHGLQHGRMATMHEWSVRPVGHCVREREDIALVVIKSQ